MTFWLRAIPSRHFRTSIRAGRGKYVCVRARVCVRADGNFAFYRSARRQSPPAKTNVRRDGTRCIRGCLARGVGGGVTVVGYIIIVAFKIYDWPPPGVCRNVSLDIGVHLILQRPGFWVIYFYKRTHRSRHFKQILYVQCFSSVIFNYCP